MVRSIVTDVARGFASGTAKLGSRWLNCFSPTCGVMLLFDWKIAAGDVLF